MCQRRIISIICMPFVRSIYLLSLLSSIRKKIKNVFISSHSSHSLYTIIYLNCLSVLYRVDQFFFYRFLSLSASQTHFEMDPNLQSSNLYTPSFGFFSIYIYVSCSHIHLELIQNENDFRIILSIER